MSETDEARARDPRRPDMTDTTSAELADALIRVDAVAKRSKDGRVFIDYRDWEPLLDTARKSLRPPERDDDVEIAARALCRAAGHPDADIDYRWNLYEGKARELLALLRPQPAGDVAGLVERLATRVVQDVCKLPDHALLVTGDELRGIVAQACEDLGIAALTARAAPPAVAISPEEVCAADDPETCCRGAACDYARKEYGHTAAALSAREAPGWRLVPEEPTPEMLGAFWRFKNGHHFADEPPPTDTSDYGAYRAMLAAAPQPKEG